MKRVNKRRLSALLAVVLLLSVTACSTKEQPQVQEEAPVVQLEQTPVVLEETNPRAAVAALLQTTSPSPTVGTVGGEWLVLGLARSDVETPEEYFNLYYKNVEDYTLQCGGILHDRKYSEYSRVILALTAIGKDPTDVAGYDLIKPLADFEKTCFQGINGPVFALIALDSGNYEMPVAEDGAVQASREMYIDLLLEKQLENGGWCLNGDQMETDMTAMVLQALSNYREREDVAAAVERGLDALSQAQNDDGSFSSNDGSSCESIAQAIVALTELGISLDSERFVKNGRTLEDSLMDFQTADGGFCHLIGEEFNQMATEQAFYALVSIRRAEQSKTPLYDMNDVE